MTTKLGLGVLYGILFLAPYSHGDQKPRGGGSCSLPGARCSRTAVQANGNELFHQGPAASVISSVFDSSSSSTDAPPPISAPRATSGTHSNRILVRLKPTKNSLSPAPGILKVNSLRFAKSTKIIEVKSGQLQKTLASLKSDPNVEYAELDPIVHRLNTTASRPKPAAPPSNDPMFSAQWGLSRIQSPKAWGQRTDAQEVVVGILDTGIDFSHPDLKQNLWTDNQGHHGIDCRVRGKLEINDSHGQDDQGHGTHVAGVIGATGNNRVGVSGVNWNVKLMALKFLWSNGGGYVSDAIWCIEKAIELKKSGINLRVLNNSWGGSERSQLLEDSFRAATAEGILIVAAAGNDSTNTDIYPTYPGSIRMPGLVSVLASKENDKAARFTNFGTATADISAPGVGILSTSPTGDCELCDPSGYLSLSGTSMATPHVAGVAAALFAENPSLTAEQARNILLDPSNLDKTTNVILQRSTTLGGRLNHAKVLSSPQVFYPPANSNPTIRIKAPLTLGGKQSGQLEAYGSDPDKDPIQIQWSVGAYSNLIPFAFAFYDLVRALNVNESARPGLTVVAPKISFPISIPYVASATDGRGGSAIDKTFLTIQASNTSDKLPKARLTADVLNDTKLRTSVKGSDPNGGPLYSLMTLSGRNPGNYGWWVLSPLGDTVTITFKEGTRDVYRVRGWAMNKRLQLVQTKSKVVFMGEASDEIPPFAQLSSHMITGVKIGAPVTIDAAPSRPGKQGSKIKAYYFDCGNVQGADLVYSADPKFTCTYDQSGIFRATIQVIDDSGLSDMTFAWTSVLAE